MLIISRSSSGAGLAAAAAVLVWSQPSQVLSHLSLIDDSGARACQLTQLLFYQHHLLLAGSLALPRQRRPRPRSPGWASGDGGGGWAEAEAAAVIPIQSIVVAFRSVSPRRAGACSAVLLV